MLRFVFLFVVCAASISPARAIVGGNAGGNAWRHSVMLTSRGGEICSGTLIARDLVITAAHCVAKSDSYAVEAGGTTIAVVQIAVHPRYRADSFETRKPSPDLAILKLASPAPGNIRPAPLSKDATLPPRNTRYLIAGFGVVAEGNRTSVGTLRTAQLPSVGTTGAIMVRLALSNGSPPRGSCDGDSGGSVYREEDGRLVLHAVIGWATGRTGKGCGAVTGATLIGIQLEWIRATARRFHSTVD
ncbi:MAG: trypsin-like serine protease [Xanthobacteraceae bacterium]